MTFEEKLKELETLREELREGNINFQNKLAKYHALLGSHLGITNVAETDIVEAIRMALEVQKEDK